MRPLKNLKLVILVTAIIAGLFVLSGLLAGCNEKQLAQADKIIADVNNFATGGTAVMNSPAGDAIPEPVNSVTSLVLLLASASVNVYQKWRNSIVTKKYSAMKAGKEQLAIENPQAAEQLHKMVAVERKVSGL